ncbi:metallophosphoesterase [Catenovulum adriaticum]|uniref:Metallophosphoesterase n=1 Tax=Catenovulum adriaticum TaxID=2984846 RepID=A0ABY7ASB3_9ALTE|nr:metallophosphoesterase [Catenovulum sp. TS8]WAJ72167.1 metallophosphoesterase [Catenovulum sp. TS8]
MKLFKQAILAGFICLLTVKAFANDLVNTRIAFLPDIHFQDIYANLNLDDQSGFKIPMLVRSMRAQINSTRLFNEPYFAFITALDDLAKKGIKLVVLPGDFSDDGQPVHLQKLKQLFAHYEQRYGMRFYLSPGNHDPAKPWKSAHGKADFLNAQGQEYSIYSLQHSACKTKPIKADYCNDNLSAMGYQGLFDSLGEFGFSPRKDDLYFETPFSDYSLNDYNVKKGQQAAALVKREFSLCADSDNCMQMPDLSYLVEPIKGLWLLSIDANVYEPKSFEQNLNKISQLQNSDLLNGSSYAGFNSVIHNKAFLIDWIKTVVTRAKAHNKTLIAFSHFPLGDFYDQSAQYLAHFAGKDTFNKRRFPLEQTLKTFADTGLKLHIAGHMHINDSSVYQGEKGNALFNIQAPSIAAYSPAYKLITLNSASEFEVETIAIDQVENFDILFEYYKKEHAFLTQNNPQKIWSSQILSAKNYREFTEFHLLGLIQSRFLARDWQASEISLFKQLSGLDLIALSLMDAQVQLSAEAIISQKQAYEKFNQSNAWGNAMQQAKHWLVKHQQAADSWQWPAMRLIEDFFRLSNADALARREDITIQQINLYRLLISNVNPDECHITSQLDSETNFINRFSCLILTLEQYINSEPSDHFVINLKHLSLEKK